MYYSDEAVVVLVVPLLKIIKPTAPATSELIKMLIFELWTILGSPKASKVMKMDMVNPMPPKKPAPIMCFQVRSAGNWDKPTLTASRLNSDMPSDFPANRPAKIPRLFNVNKPPIQSPDRAMPVFASAKIGMTINATGLCRICCNP